MLRDEGSVGSVFYNRPKTYLLTTFNNHNATKLARTSNTSELLIKYNNLIQSKGQVKNY